MNKSAGTSYIKSKIATLLSKMVTDAKLTYNEITDKLIDDDFLDCFEKNDISIIYNKSCEAIIHDLFRKEGSYSEEIDPVVYWCGEQYISLFLNKRIPLKQLFLLCPLKQMESYYNVYHEQNESKFIQMFIKKDYKESILKKIRKKRGYSARELSILSSVSINTIKYYENNNNLYRASFENINKILSVLNYSDSLVKEKTNFVPSYISLINIKEIKKNFDNYISLFVNSNVETEYINGDFWIKGQHKKKIDRKVVEAATVYAIENYNENKLLF